MITARIEVIRIPERESISGQQPAMVSIRATWDGKGQSIDIAEDAMTPGLLAVALRTLAINIEQMIEEDL